MKNRLPKNRVPVSVSIPFDELAEIDDTAYTMGLTRSDFILQATRAELKKVKEEQNRG